MKDKEMIVGIGDWGNPPHHTTPRNNQRQQNPYLMRECPGCGREVLRHRQRLCDDCRRIHRQKTKRENYYKSKRL